MFGRKIPYSGPPLPPPNAAQAGRAHDPTADILARLAQDYLKEKRTKRRWGLAFKVLILLYLGGLLYAYLQSTHELGFQSHTAVVELTGLIGPEEVSADLISSGLRQAFDAEQAKGVVLRVNSAGGTPVQAAQINRQIRRLRAQYPDKPFYVVIADICTSGCYYVAVAAETIYAHPASLVGSIGVRLDSFGFVDSLAKLGVERRLFTAGSNKGLLDPFLPLDAAEKQHVESILAEVHQQFIQAVKTGRGNRLRADDTLFSGLLWSGQSAYRLGLIDGFSDLDQVAKEQIGAEMIVSYTPSQSAWDRLLRRLDTSLGTLLRRLLTTDAPWQLSARAALDNRSAA